MEDDKQTEVVGISKNILIELHHRLFVATEEIHLDAFYANALKPLHLSFSGDSCRHAVAWALRGIVPIAVAVIP